MQKEADAHADPHANGVRIGTVFLLLPVAAPNAMRLVLFHCFDPTACSSDDLPAKIPRTSSSSSPTPSPTPTPDLDYLLLNRNQSTALHRLDSLEQTIATLLDHMERTDSVDVLDDDEAIAEGQGERQADSANERIVP